MVTAIVCLTLRSKVKTRGSSGPHLGHLPVDPLSNLVIILLFTVFFSHFPYGSCFETVHNCFKL